MNNAFANIAPFKMEFDDPIQRYANALQVAKYSNELAKARRAEEVQNKMRAGYKQHFRDGRLDEVGFTDWMAQNDLGDEIPDVQKGILERGKIGAETQHKRAEALKTGVDAFASKLKNGREFWGRVSDDPRTGARQIVEHLMTERDDPEMAQFHQMHNSDPNALFEDALEIGRAHV